MLKQDEICREILSLENEIEFLKEAGQPTRRKKQYLNKLYADLKRISNINKEEPGFRNEKLWAIQTQIS
jgi:hypothetical protein